MTDDEPDFDTQASIRPLRIAIGAVVRDLWCLRYGRDVQVDRLVWELAISDQYAVTIGWSGPGSAGSTSATAYPWMPAYTQAAVWGATQGVLTSYEFIQWPSRGQHILNPRLRQEGPVWVDPHTDTAVAATGELCKHRTAWDAHDRPVRSVNSGRFDSMGTADGASGTPALAWPRERNPYRHRRRSRR
ncbi:hypothetical protein [Rhodococcus sp. WAY2]|uniref:hypothetical protein n=1 Tax=Rhodococcus sp. WAY2 TaxID=2663121 RepID=UPI001F2F9F41|nr:hypothetical protein [Rhodococcus sp. WAY2]